MNKTETIRGKGVEEEMWRIDCATSKIQRFSKVKFGKETSREIDDHLLEIL